MLNSPLVAHRPTARTVFRIAIPTAVLALVLSAAAVAPAAVLNQELMSRTTAGVSGNSQSQYSSISGDGRCVAFTSYASDLVTGDTNGTQDVFVRDRLRRTTERVSVSSTGVQGNSDCTWESISGDGRYVAFVTAASTLVPGDTNGLADVFLRDRFTGITKRLGVGWNGTEANGAATYCAISANGRYVALSSAATNLVAGDTNGTEDVFIVDTANLTTRRASVATGGAQGNGVSSTPDVSGDGRYVAFGSVATNLVAGDTNSAKDAFVHDFTTGATTRVNVSSAAAQANAPTDNFPRLSADGRYVTFATSASNLVASDTGGFEDAFVRDNVSGTIKRVSLSSAGVEGNSGTYGHVAVSADGRYTAFVSSASNFVPGDANGMGDIYLHDAVTGATSRVSLGVAGAEPNQGCFIPVSISRDGHYVAFTSGANNLTAGDTNGLNYDVYVTQVIRNTSSISRSPSKSKKTYRRRSGKAKFTLSAAVNGDFGRPLASAKVYLQVSLNGKKWKNVSKLHTNASGRVSKRFTARSASKKYYRWYLSAASKWASAKTSKQRITVR